MNCAECRFFSRGYCKLINHALENGEAMEFHSQRCNVEHLFEDDYYVSLNRLLRGLQKGSTILMSVHPQSDRKVIRNAEEIAYPWTALGGDYDTVFCLDCLEHAKNFMDIMAFLSTAKRVVISVPNPLYWPFDGQRKTDHGFGPHINRISRSFLRQYFETLDYKVKIQGIRHSWMGFASFGTFMVADRK